MYRFNHHGSAAPPPNFRGGPEQKIKFGRKLNFRGGYEHSC